METWLPFVLFSLATGCAPPGFVQSNDPGNVGARCSDLILYPVSAVDQSDQYRFDYSDVSFGNTHSQGATVAITCTTGGQPATVEGYDQRSFMRHADGRQHGGRFFFLSWIPTLLFPAYYVGVMLRPWYFIKFTWVHRAVMHHYFGRPRLHHRSRHSVKFLL